MLWAAAGARPHVASLAERRPGLRHFVITGYPRSGTAWLANLFTWGPSLCVHDPQELVERGEGDPFDPGWAPEGIEHLGYADAGWGLYRPVDAAPLAIIWRQRLDAEKSFLAFAERLTHAHAAATEILNAPLLARSGFRACADALEHLAGQRPDHFAIHFSELGDRDSVERLWHHLLPGVSFPVRRFELLKRMRITTDLERRGLWAS